MEFAEHDANFPMKKSGFCGSAPMDLQEIKDAIAETKSQIEEYEKQATEDADSDVIKEKFTGVVFVIFESPTDCIRIKR